LEFLLFLLLLFCVGVGTWVLALRIFKNLPSEVGGWVGPRW
jgi:hypothetical protein